MLNRTLDILRPLRQVRENYGVGDLDTDALEQFERDGFAVVDRLVDGSEIDRLQSILFSLHVSNVGFTEGAQFDAVSDDDGCGERRFPQIINPHQYAPDLLKGAFFDRAKAVATQLLGETARFKADISFLKPALIGSETPWHQDEAFGSPDFDYTEVSIWLALTDAGVHNSCMGFLPGSHKMPVLEHRPLGGNTKVHVLECVGDFDRSKIVMCPLSPGGCTLHTNRTLHYAGPNTSNQPRLAYVLIFDAAPVKARERREFPWQRSHHPARAIREKRWRKRGGLILHAWRQRHRIRGDRFKADILRFIVAIRNLRRR